MSEPNPPKVNTDRQLWRSDVDSVSVTEDGRLTLCHGGYCVTRTFVEWIDSAEWTASRRERRVRDQNRYLGRGA